MNVLIVNAGSSSLKYQLIDTKTETVEIFIQHSTRTGEPVVLRIAVNADLFVSAVGVWHYEGGLVGIFVGDDHRFFDLLPSIFAVTQQEKRHGLEHTSVNVGTRVFCKSLACVAGLQLT